MCEALQVSRSGYYSWIKGEESARSRENRRLTELIRKLHEEHRKVYGSPRIHALLRRLGERCGLNRVARLMREAGIRARQARKFKATTNSRHNLPVALNLLRRDFQAPKPDTVWVSDITYIATDEGWLYLATTLDLWGRKIVGWSMSERMTKTLACDALEMALACRKPEPGLIHHSDRGSQYASKEFQHLLDRHQIRCSMSRKGNCWDNAVMESFYHSLKTELVYLRHFRTRAEAKRALFEFIEVFYNRQRLHSSLGYQPPEEFETLRVAS